MADVQFTKEIYKKAQHEITELTYTTEASKKIKFIK